MRCVEQARAAKAADRAPLAVGVENRGPETVLVQAPAHGCERMAPLETHDGRLPEDRIVVEGPDFNRSHVECAPTGLVADDVAQQRAVARLAHAVEVDE